MILYSQLYFWNESLLSSISGTILSPQLYFWNNSISSALFLEQFYLLWFSDPVSKAYAMTKFSEHCFRVLVINVYIFGTAVIWSLEHVPVFQDQTNLSEAE